jgi:hypothetical protein
MLRGARRLALIVCVLSLLLSTGCAEPPNKEMNQAQGAIDAARAAGADKFAAAEFTAAIDALQRSEQAVADGDYRQALSHAIDSRERAQNAAKLAVDGRADARGQAERAVAEAATLLDRAQAELAAPELARVATRALKSPRAVVSAAEHSLQEARTALKAEDYAGVNAALDGVAARLQAALSEIDKAAASRAPSGRR